MDIINNNIICTNNNNKVNNKVIIKDIKEVILVKRDNIDFDNLYKFECFYLNTKMHILKNFIFFLIFYLLFFKKCPLKL